MLSLVETLDRWEQQNLEGEQEKTGLCHPMEVSENRKGWATIWSPHPGFYYT